MAIETVPSFLAKFIGYTVFSILFFSFASVFLFINRNTIHKQILIHKMSIYFMGQ